jgi:acetyl-CoA C-acetyltransferase
VRDVAVYGVGTSEFGKQPGTTIFDLAWRACREALDDAGVDHVDAVFAGSVYEPTGTAQRILHGLGIAGVPVVAVENACASATIAYHEAYESIRRGRYDVVLAMGIEHMSSHITGAIQPQPSDPEGRMGFAQPARYAMAAQRYMHQYGATPEQLAAVAVKNSENGALNDRARRRSALTLDQVLGSRMIADPLTLYQCCSISDGAAAAILGPPRNVATEVAIRSSALVGGALWDYKTDDVPGFNIVRRAGEAAYEAAEATPDDVDLFEVHDAFTIGEIVTSEALGIVDRGLGAELAESGGSAVGGTRPINPSGGLLARGHPVGATGLAQVAEVVWQLRGQAGDRQVADARLGLVETAGGGAAGLDWTACVVSILDAGQEG